jgi:hypothetical protein
MHPSGAVITKGDKLFDVPVSAPHLTQVRTLGISRLFAEASPQDFGQVNDPFHVYFAARFGI